MQCTSHATKNRLPFTSLLGFSSVLTIGLSAPGNSDPCAPRDTEPDGPYLAFPVEEGVGFAGVELDDPAERVEEVLGEAGGGCEHSLRYPESCVSFCLCGGKVRVIHFLPGFRGRLVKSALGMGDTLEAVEEAYGEITKEREVDELCGWQLDRTLLIRRGGAMPDDPTVAKVYYYEAGVYFQFDEQYQVYEFGLFRKTGYAHRQNDARPIEP